VFSLQVGDVVSYDEIDYVVQNKITFEEGGDTWFDYMLVDAATESEIWLSAEDDDGVTVGIFREVDLDVTVPPVPRSLTHDGHNYRQREHSNANVTVEREDATRSSSSSVEYWEFEAPGERYMTVARWGGSYEVSVGESIEEYELKIYPRVD